MITAILISITISILELPSIFGIYYNRYIFLPSYSDLELIQESFNIDLPKDIQVKSLQAYASNYQPDVSVCMELEFSTIDECQKFMEDWKQLSNVESIETSIDLDMKDNHGCCIMANGTLYHTSYINEYKNMIRANPIILLIVWSITIIIIYLYKKMTKQKNDTL